MFPGYWLLLAASLLTVSALHQHNGDIGSIDGLQQQHQQSGRPFVGREQSNCIRVGHTRRVKIPDCVAFVITTNACRGSCESWSVPTTWESLMKNPGKAITSIGHCCNIMESEDVTVRVMCVGGPRDFTFKSAKTCSCFHCKKD